MFGEDEIVTMVVGETLSAGDSLLTDASIGLVEGASF